MECKIKELLIFTIYLFYGALHFKVFNLPTKRVPIKKNEWFNPSWPGLPELHKGLGGGPIF